MPQDYNLAAFRADLKAVMLRAGVERRPTCLFLEDHQLGDPAFLECINSLLSGGEVSTACFIPGSRAAPQGGGLPVSASSHGGHLLSSSCGTLSSWSGQPAQLRIRVTGWSAVKGAQWVDVVFLGCIDKLLSCGEGSISVAGLVAGGLLGLCIQRTYSVAAAGGCPAVMHQQPAQWPVGQL